MSGVSCLGETSFLVSKENLWLLWWPSKPVTHGNQAVAMRLGDGWHTLVAPPVGEWCHICPPYITHITNNNILHQKYLAWHEASITNTCPIITPIYHFSVAGISFMNLLFCINILSFLLNQKTFALSAFSQGPIVVYKCSWKHFKKVSLIIEMLVG